MGAILALGASVTLSINDTARAVLHLLWETTGSAVHCRCPGAWQWGELTPREPWSHGGSHPLLLKATLWTKRSTQVFKGRSFATSSGGWERQIWVQSSTLPPGRAQQPSGGFPAMGLCFLVYRKGTMSSISTMLYPGDTVNPLYTPTPTRPPHTYPLESWAKYNKQHLNTRLSFWESDEHFQGQKWGVRSHQV